MFRLGPTFLPCLFCRIEYKTNDGEHLKYLISVDASPPNEAMYIREIRSAKTRDSGVGGTELDVLYPRQHVLISLEN